MEITKSQKRLYCMNFYMSVYTRDRVQVFRTEKLYQAFLIGVEQSLQTAGCTLLSVTRGAENSKGKLKYGNAFVTLHIHTDYLSPEQVFQLVYRDGWDAICEVDAGEHGYTQKFNYLTKDFLITGEETYDKELIYRYAYTRNEQTGRDNEPGDADGAETDNRKRLYGF